MARGDYPKGIRMVRGVSNNKGNIDLNSSEKKPKLFAYLIFLGFVPLAFGFFGNWNWILDLFSHFRVYYVIYFGVIGVLAFLFKKKKEGIIASALTLILLSSIVRFYIPNSSDSINAPDSIKVGSINLLSSNQNYEQVLDYVEEENFDVIFFLEVNSAWEGQLNMLLEQYESRLFVTREDNFGIGVLSKLESTEITEIDLSVVNVPSILIEYPTSTGKLTILGTHPLPPIGVSYFHARNDQLDRINEFLKTIDGQTVIIGDLNSTVFSPNFRRLTRSEELMDTRRGFGLLQTWHADISFIKLTLDHILVSEGIEVLDRGVGPNIGSDHLPVYAELGFND